MAVLPSEEEFVITVRNDTNEDVQLQWFNPVPEESDYDFGILKVKETIELNSRNNHVWYARDLKTNEILQTFEVQGPGGMYHIRPQPKKEAIDKIIEKEKEKFVEIYKKENDRDWINVFPREKTMHFIWDPIRKGAKQTIMSSASFYTKNEQSPKLEKQTFTLETLSESPRIFKIENCLSEDEVSKILELSNGKLERSTIVNEDGSGLILSDIRTSSTCWIKYSQDPVIENIFDRISDILKIDREQIKYQSSEMLQVVGYKEQQEFKHHHDYLDPVSHFGNSSIMRGNNRMATFLFYLVTPDKGGETDFPFSDAGENNKGISVSLARGSAVLFYSMLPDGNLDEKSFHAGLPVIEGEKYIANLWVWDRVFK